MGTDAGIILYEDGTLHGEPCAQLAALGWLTRCPADTLEMDDPPCGYRHRGEGFYHLAPGRHIDDLPLLPLTCPPSSRLTGSTAPSGSA